MNNPVLILFDINVFKIKSVIKKVKGKPIDKNKMRKTSHHAIYNNLPIEVFSYIKMDDNNLIEKLLKQHSLEQSSSIIESNFFQSKIKSGK